METINTNAVMLSKMYMTYMHNVKTEQIYCREQPEHGKYCCVVNSELVFIRL